MGLPCQFTVRDRDALGLQGTWYHQGGMTSIHPLFISIVIGPAKQVFPAWERRETIDCRVSAGKYNTGRN